MSQCVIRTVRRLSMNSCENCKWWDMDEEGYEYGGCKPCEHPQNGKFFIGGGDCNDGLYTKKDFFCSEHTPKD